MTEEKKEVVAVMLDSLRGNVTFKFNYDNIQETIDIACADVIETQKRIIDVFEGNKNKHDFTYMNYEFDEYIFNVETATDKEIIKNLKDDLKEYQEAFDEISDFDFINKLRNGETDHYYFVDFHLWHENQNRKDDSFVKKIIDEGE